MTFTYSQTSGIISKPASGDTPAWQVDGYSGHGGGLNTPALEAWHDTGPIPQGQWHIGPAHDTPDKGPIVMALTPVGHNAYGRAGFLIHGAHPNDHHDSSHGCIILPRPAREYISQSGDTDLEVIP